MKLIKLFDKKKEMIIEETLPDVQHIKVPDLKQYLLNGYKEIREIKQENEQLQLKLEEEHKYKILYDGALVTLDEFKTREDENKNKINKLQTKLNEKQEELFKLNDLLNTYKIKQLEVDKQLKNMDKLIQDNINFSIINFKEVIIHQIKNTKGNISKDKVCNLIQKSDNPELLEEDK
jgi:hypothetical protein